MCHDGVYILCMYTDMPASTFVENIIMCAHIQSLLFYASLQAFSTLDRKLAFLVEGLTYTYKLSQKPKLLQFLYGDSLKSAKNCRFAYKVGHEICSEC